MEAPLLVQALLAWALMLLAASVVQWMSL